MAIDMRTLQTIKEIGKEIKLFDDFDDESLSTSIWGTATVTGSTTVTESSSAPNTLRIYNPGTGTTGSGYISSILAFSRNVSVRSKIEVYNGEAAGDGEQCIGRIELYEDSDNYIQFGVYRDTSASINSRGYITYNIDAGGATTVDTDTTDIDNIAREYRIDVTDENILFYIDDIIVYTLKNASLNNFYIRPYATTQNNTDDLDIRFDYVKVLLLNEEDRVTYKKLLQIQGGSDSIGTITNALNSTLDMGYYSSAVTPTDGTENDIYDDSDDNVFKHCLTRVDLTNMVAGDTVTLREYAKIDSSTEILFDEKTYTDAQPIDGIKIKADEGIYGIRIALLQSAAPYREFKYLNIDEMS